MFRNSLLRCSTSVLSRRGMAMKPIKGRATTAGTAQFLRDSDLPFFHKLAKSDLFINPIIHGPPRELYSKSDQKRTFIEALTRRAVVKNRSNCLVVYQHNPEGEAWYSTNLHALFQDPANRIAREQIVIVANLGRATSREEVFRRLSDACQVTGLETIDIAMFEIDETVMAYKIDETADTLQTLCEQSMLQAYGFQISVAPYVYHNPPLQRSGPEMMLPMDIENDRLRQESSYADLVFYPISPTTAIPSTYPMLAAHASDSDAEEDAGGDSSDDEDTRTFTRGAMNPLTCRFGGRASLRYESPKVLEARRIRRVKTAGKHTSQVGKTSAGEEFYEFVDDADADELVEVDLVTGLNDSEFELGVSEVLDRACPELETTPLLQEKALRLVFSVGIDVMIVDAEHSAMLGPLALQEEDLLNAEQTQFAFTNFCLSYRSDGDSSGDEE